MAFLDAADYTPHIKAQILEKLTEGVDANRTKMEKVVQEEISMALRVRYDVPKIFTKAGDERNQYLIEMFVNMVVYKLAKKHSPGQISEQIKTNYENAKADLDKVAAGSFALDLPLVGDADEDGDDDNAAIQWGSQAPRNPYY